MRAWIVKTGKYAKSNVAAFL